MRPAQNTPEPIPTSTDWLAFFRQRIIFLLLGSTAAIATLGIVYILRPYIQRGVAPSWNVWIYLLAYLGLLVLTFSPRISVAVRSYAFLALLYAFSVFSLYSGWLASSGRSYLLALIVLSTILAGVRAGIVASALSLLTYLVFGLAYHFAWLPLPTLPPPSETAPITIEGFGFMMTVGLIAISMWFFREGMAAVSRVAAESQNARTELDQRARDLDEANRLLAERTHHLEMTNQALELQMWQTNGKSQLNDVLRVEQDISSLAHGVARFLAHYVSAEIAGIYIPQDDGRLLLCGSFAMSAAAEPQSFALGEGLVGQAALKKRTIQIRDIPKGHLVVRSGLGETQPDSVLSVPLVVNDQVSGVVELGFLNAPGLRQVQFLENVSESIAMAINAVRTRERVEMLLSEAIHPPDGQSPL